jgi:hypothetical protein
MLLDHKLPKREEQEVNSSKRNPGGIKMKRRSLAIIIAIALLALTASVVYAEIATVTITGGTLSVAGNDITFAGVTLDGTDQVTTSASGSNNWSATDARGTGAGWNLTIVATDFSDGGTRTLDISSADQEFMIQLLDTNVGVTAGNTQPVSQVATLTAIPESPAAALKFLSAAVDTGMGSYTLNPNFALDIPAETYVGTGTYTSTVTITAVSGP